MLGPQLRVSAFLRRKKSTTQSYNNNTTEPAQRQLSILLLLILLLPPLQHTVLRRFRASFTFVFALLFGHFSLTAFPAALASEPFGRVGSGRSAL